MKPLRLRNWINLLRKDDLYGGLIFVTPPDVDLKEITSELSSLILETMVEGLIVFDLSDQIIHVNSAIENIVGCPKTELIGKKIGEFVADYEHDRFHEINQQLIDSTSQKSSIRFELDLVRVSDEQTIMCLVGSGPIFQAGKIVAIFTIVTDISSTKAQAKALVESIGLNQAILDNMTDGLIVASPEGTITQANAALDTMLNYKRGELVGKPISDVHPPNELPKLGQIDQLRKDQLSKGIPFGSKYEIAFIRQDGRIIDTLVGGAPLVGADGEFLGTFGIVTDITQQKIQQQKLRESYELNEMILRTMGEGLWLVDENDRTIMVNRALENLLGYEQGEMLGRSVYDFIPEDQHEVLQTINGQRKEATSFDNGQKFSSRYEMELLHKSGAKIYSLVSGTAILDRNENFKGTFGIITDITERKRLEETIRETRDYLQLLLDNSADAIAATKIDGSIIFSNKAMSNLIGLEEKELSLRELLADGNLFDIMVSEVGKGSRFFRTELLRSDKRFVPVGISMGAVSDSWGNPDMLVSVIRDLTEKERTAKELMLFREYVVDQVHASIFKIGEMGADLVETDVLPFVPNELPEERDRFFLKIGTFFLAAIGQGQARATGLYELPVAEFTDYRALVYAFNVQNPENPDPRADGIDYCLLAVFFPRSLELVFSDRESLRHRFEHAFSDILHVDDLRKDFLQRIKRRILVGK